MGQNCRKCGAPLEPEASFCTVCGAAVHDRQESGISDASKAKKRKKQGLLWAVWLAARQLLSCWRWF